MSPMPLRGKLGPSQAITVLLYIDLMPLWVCCCCTGDPKKLLDDCAVLKPTVFCAVPRVFERVYAGVMDKVRPGVRR